MKCLVCHRTLKDKESINRKIGPVCWGRLVKLTKEEKAKRKARQESNKRATELLKGQISLFEEGEK